MCELQQHLYITGFVEIFLMASIELYQLGDQKDRSRYLDQNISKNYKTERTLFAFLPVTFVSDAEFGAL